MAGQLISKVTPVYPAAAKQQHISGAVVAHVLISTEGRVTEAHIVSGPKALRENFLAAVRQWRYKPYLLNGVAVPVDTIVTMNISFGQ